MERVILEFNDWNYQDKFYEAPVEVLKTFKKLAFEESLEKAWEWFTTQVDYGKEPNLPVKTGRIDMNLPRVFLCWEDPKACLDEWEFDDE